MSASGWGVDEFHDTVTEPCDIGEVQGWRGVDVFKPVLAPPDRDRCHQEVELVNQVVFHQGGVERTVPVLDDVGAGLSFEVGDERGHVPSMTVAFHAVSRSVVDAPYLGRLFMRSMKPLSTSEPLALMVGYAADNPSSVNRPATDRPLPPTDGWRSRCVSLRYGNAHCGDPISPPAETWVDSISFLMRASSKPP
jgi:hypothetical protein